MGTINVKLEGPAASPAAPTGDAAATAQAIRGLSEDWEKYDCGVREGDYESLKCQNVLSALQKCGVDTSKVRPRRPSTKDSSPPPHCSGFLPNDSAPRHPTTA